jgi:hypothetical protein
MEHSNDALATKSSFDILTLISTMDATKRGSIIHARQQ